VKIDVGSGSGRFEENQDSRIDPLSDPKNLLVPGQSSLIMKE
jgi:hypothetical protein